MHITIYLIRTNLFFFRILNKKKLNDVKNDKKVTAFICAPQAQNINYAEICPSK